MKKSTIVSKPEFSGSRPILNVSNVARSLEYYSERLGFKIGFQWSEQAEFNEKVAPSFAQVGRGDFFLMLSQQSQGGPGMWIYLDLSSTAQLQSLYEEYQTSGAIIASPPQLKSWGMLEMLVQDLDGHTLRIGAPVPVKDEPPQE